MPPGRPKKGTPKPPPTPKQKVGVKKAATPSKTMTIDMIVESWGQAESAKAATIKLINAISSYGTPKKEEPPLANQTAAMPADAKKIEILKGALEQAKEKIAEQDKMLQRLTAEPLRFATVISIRPEHRSKKVPPPEPGGEVLVLRGPDAGKTLAIENVERFDGGIVVVTKDGNRRWLKHADGQALVRRPAEAVGDNALIGDYVDIIWDADVHSSRRGRLVTEPDETDLVKVETTGKCSYYGDERTCEHFYYIDLGPQVEVLGQLVPATAIVLYDGREVEVRVPEDEEVNVGDTVKISMQSLQIVGLVDTKFAGEIVEIKNVLDNASSEVELGGGTRAVYNGRFNGQLQNGDRVVLDPSGLVIIRNLGQEEKKDDLFAFNEPTNVSWDDIGGLMDAKREMREAIEMPYKYGDLYSFYGKKPLKGVLLYGPPGCGKTMLGKAAATALSHVHSGKGSETSYMYIKAPEILSKYVGVAEATVRRVFAAARKHRAEHGYPAVIFIDEADAILNKRGSGVSSDIDRTIVPMFLAEMDGFEDSGAVVILATNRADSLDPAIVREGRISRKIKVSRPDVTVTGDLFKLKLRGIPLHNGYSRDELAVAAAEDLFDEARTIYTLIGKDKANHKFTLGHLVSGAMVTEIVDQATSIALHRDMAVGKPGGLRAADLQEAINRAFAQNADLNHDDDVRAFVETHGVKVERLVKVAV